MLYEKKDMGAVNITILGIGNSGINAVNRMIEANIEAVDYIAVSMFELELEKSNANNKVLLSNGNVMPKDSNMDCNFLESIILSKKDEFDELLKDTNMLFLVGGMGGAVATQVMPVIAKLFSQLECLTVAIATKPFIFEGRKRTRLAEESLLRTAEYVDTLIIISNEKVKMLSGGIKTMKEAYATVDEVIRESVQSIIELITAPAFMKLDFEDLRTAMSSAGYAHIGFGRGAGKNKAYDAAQMAIKSPTLENEISKSKVVLLNITVPEDIGIEEAEIVTSVISKDLNPETNIFAGLIIDKDLEDEMQITLVAIGYDSHILMFEENLKVIYNQPKTKADKSFESILELFKKSE